MHTTLGGADYRDGALQRLREAGLLLEKEAFAGAVYLAGRAVEGMLRAVIWRHDADIRTGKQSLDTGHDLREMLVRVRNLGIIRDFEVNAELSATIQHIGRLWSNNMRFWATAKLNRHWRALGEISRRRTLSFAAADFLKGCKQCIARCERLGPP
jgi:hypothetical protein